MSDLYTELIVKRKKTAADTLKKALLIAGTVIGALAFITMGIIGLIILVVFAVADYFLLPTFDVEYEYIYVNGELDVDKIMSKQKRKRVYSMDAQKLELMAPSNSHVLDYHNQNKNIKTLDFSSGEEGAKTYTMIVQGEKGLERVIFEPNEVIIKDMKRIAPREVNLM